MSLELYSREWVTAVANHSNDDDVKLLAKEYLRLRMDYNIRESVNFASATLSHSETIAAMLGEAKARLAKVSNILTGAEALLEKEETDGEKGRDAKSYTGD